MGVSKRFVVTKDNLTDAITYLEYERKKGFSIKPKSNVSFSDMIDVEKMVIINPSLIEKLVDKKCKKTLEKIIRMTSIIYEDDEDTGGNLGIILDEIEKFKQLITNKYKEYMKEKEYKVLLKKLDIIESEVNLRKLALTFNNSNSSKPKKGR